MRWSIESIVALLLALGALGAPAEDLAPVEVWALAQGPPRFGEQPWIRGNIVVWQRYSGVRSKPDTIEYLDIGKPGSPIGTVTTYPASSTGVFVGPEHLFWGNQSLPPVRARPLEDLDSEEDLFVSETGEVVAASEDYVFIWVLNPGDGWRGGKLYAKSTAEIGNRSPETLRLVVEVRKESRYSRGFGASRRYLLWLDAVEGATGEVWKVFARRTEDLFATGRVDVTLDTEIPALYPGLHLHLHETVLAFHAGLMEGGRLKTIEIVDLDRPDSQATLAAATATTMVDWPVVSRDYVAWTELVDFFERRAYVVPLVDGAPAAPPSDLTPDGGSWLMLDGNIAVWNGTSFDGVNPVQEAIVAAELPLPGASDCGDLDQDARVNVTDAILLLDHLFRGGPRPRQRLADMNLDGRVSLADAVGILRHLFAGESRPCAEGG